MLDSRPLVLILAAVTVVGTSPHRQPRSAPKKAGGVMPQPPPASRDAPGETGEDGKKPKKQVLPSNSLTGVWHRGGGEPGKVRPEASSLTRPIWHWPTLSRHLVHAGHVEAAALPIRSPRPQLAQPHAPPAAS